MVEFGTVLPAGLVVCLRWQDLTNNSTEVTIDKHDKKALSVGPLILCVPQSGEGHNAMCGGADERSFRSCIQCLGTSTVGTDPVQRVNSTQEQLGLWGYTELQKLTIQGLASTILQSHNCTGLGVLIFSQVHISGHS